MPRGDASMRRSRKWFCSLDLETGHDVVEKIDYPVGVGLSHRGEARIVVLLAQQVHAHRHHLLRTHQTRVEQHTYDSEQHYATFGGKHLQRQAEQQRQSHTHA